MTNRRLPRLFLVTDETDYPVRVGEHEILAEMAEGRLWLAEFLKVVLDHREDTAHLIFEGPIANVVAQIEPVHQAALAAIFLQREVLRVTRQESVRPSDARVVDP